MKKILTAVIATALLNISVAQEAIQPVPQKKHSEFHLRLTSLSPLGISVNFKRQLGQRSYLNVGLVNLSVRQNTISRQVSTSFPAVNSQYSAGLQLGFEFRRSINEKFTFFHGPSLSGTYQYGQNSIDDPSTGTQGIEEHAYEGGVIYSFGILFHAGKHILVGAQLDPTVVLGYRTVNHYQNPQANYNNESINFQITSRSGFISIVYRM